MARYTNGSITRIDTRRFFTKKRGRSTRVLYRPNQIRIPSKNLVETPFTPHPGNPADYSPQCTLFYPETTDYRGNNGLHLAASTDQLRKKQHAPSPVIRPEDRISEYPIDVDTLTYGHAGWVIVNLVSRRALYAATGRVLAQTWLQEYVAGQHRSTFSPEVSSLALMTTREYFDMRSHLAYADDAIEIVHTSSNTVVYAGTDKDGGLWLQMHPEITSAEFHVRDYEVGSRLPIASTSDYADCADIQMPLGMVQ